MYIGAKSGSNIPLFNSKKRTDIECVPSKRLKAADRFACATQKVA
jgi:hypothetical protein